MRKWIFLVLAVVVWFAADEAGAQQSLKERLIGAWTLVAVETRNKAGAEIPFVEGEKPKGMLIFTANDRFSFQVIATLPKLVSNSRLKTTADEDRAIAHGVLSYFGGYTVNEANNEISLKIEQSSFPNQSGSGGRRVVSFESADQLKVITPGSIGGATNILVWKRVP